ncbi:hypothetical protein LINGRAHAP2_LOCUS28618 [Linum grandiflorum]
MAPSFREHVKLWHIIATLLVILVIAAATVVALSLTVFRPRDPTVTVDLVGLSNIGIKDLVFSNTNLTTAIVIGIVNENYGSFTWREFTASVKYNGEDVGVVPLVDTVVPGRSNVNLTTSVILRLAKLREEHVTAVLEALAGGGFNLTCSVTVFGKIRMGRVSPAVSGSVYVECFNSVFFNHNATVENLVFFESRSSCWTRLKVGK